MFTVKVQATQTSQVRLQGVLDDVLYAIRKFPGDVAPHIVQFLDFAITTAFVKEGPGWSGLTFRTALRRMNEGYLPFHPIMYRTGFLRRKLETGIHQITAVSGDKTVILDPDYDVFVFHQFGAPKRNLPARPMVPMDEAAEEFFASLEEEVLLPTMDYLTRGGRDIA